MDLIRGVALIISGETTWHGVGERGGEGESGGKENNTDVSVHSGALERMERGREEGVEAEKDKRGQEKEMEESVELSQM